MNIAEFDLDRCQRPEKEVCEGLCLSYDLLRGLCMETSEPCEARLPVEVQPTAEETETADDL